MSFKNDIDNFVNKTNKRITDVYRKSCEMISTDIAENTPVSTGKLLGSWSPSINTVRSYDYEGGLSAWVVGPKGFKKEESIASANKLAAFTDVASRTRSITQTLNKHDTYYFTNNVSYVKNAEHKGWTKTGPSRMRENAILNWQETVNKAAAINV